MEREQILAEAATRAGVIVEARLDAVARARAHFEEREATVEQVTAWMLNALKPHAMHLWPVVANTQHPWEVVRVPQRTWETASAEQKLVWARQSQADAPPTAGREVRHPDNTLRAPPTLEAQWREESKRDGISVTTKFRQWRDSQP